MHEMWAIAIDDPGICQSRCRAASRGFAAQTRLNGSCLKLGFLKAQGTQY